MITWKEHKTKYGFITSYEAGEVGAYGYIGNIYAFYYYKLYGSNRENEKYHLYFMLDRHIKIGDYDNVEELQLEAEKSIQSWLDQANLKVKKSKR